MTLSPPSSPDASSELSASLPDSVDDAEDDPSDALEELSVPPLHAVMTPIAMAQERIMLRILFAEE